MKYLKKIGIFLVIFAFVFQSISVPISAMSNEVQIEKDNLQKATILLDANEEDVPLYKEDSETSETLSLLQSGKDVVVLKRLDDFSFVEFTKDDNKDEVLQGFILNDSLNFNQNEMLDDIFKTATILSDENEVEIPLYEEISENSETLTFLQPDDEVVVLEKSDDFSFVEYVENDEEVWQGFIQNEFLSFKENETSEGDFDQNEDAENENTNESVDSSDSEDDSITNDTEENSEEPDDLSKDESVNELEEDQSSDIKGKTDDEISSEDEIDETDKDAVKEKQQTFSVQNSILSAQEQTYFGIALQDKTHVYASQSTSSTKLRTYQQGSILKYRSLNANWYVATVSYNGKWATGYIHKNHVENITDSQSVLHGVALQNPTKIYSRASTGASTLRTYTQGSILKYKTLTSNWYEATVMHNGKWTTGYIHKKDVENSISNQMRLQGIGKQNPTTVYASASTGSKKLKSYAQGSILTYRTFSSNWYQATVYINGKGTTGYIHKNHVENSISNQMRLQGIGTQSPTTVYASASTGSKKLKSYARGSILSYKTFSNSWYQATVYINGKATTGYIHKNHVENSVANQTTLRGTGTQNPTTVYASASTGSKKLKSYAQGSILTYKTFSNSWYQATVYINGKATTGYIHKNHVEELFDTIQSLDGMALKSPTNVYAKASKKAKVLRSYSKNHYLIFKTFSPSWYVATVYINGKATTGYIHKDDVSTDKVSIEKTSYKTNFNSVVNTQMTRSPQVSGQNGGWVDASRQQIEYYVNSSNFSKSSPEYYQFLVLSQHASLNVNEVNRKILNDHGTLTGKAQSFIDAGIKHNINEAYLISHALLETGNGKSALAQGVPVDNKGNVVSEDRAVHKVHNMYGIGAVDSCPLVCGAKRAFTEGWFTPEEAIIGGAQFINTYIARGQDTLYKMRWNPISPGHPQYATDVAWAVKQTANISRIYDMLDHFILVYDVPRYTNQPSSSGDSDYYLILDGTHLEVTENNGLNVRKGAGTTNDSIGVATRDTKLALILDSNNKAITRNVGGHIWFQIEFKNSTAWVSGGRNGIEYVNVIK